MNVSLTDDDLTLREYKKSEFSIYHQWISSREIMSYLDWRTESEDESAKIFEDLLKEQSCEDRQNYYLALEYQSQITGNFGISIIDSDNRVGEIG